VRELLRIRILAVPVHGDDVVKEVRYSDQASLRRLAI
jgi:hypothetical protein